MSQIRPFEHRDLPAVAGLIGAHLPPGGHGVDHVPLEFLTGTLLASPWASPDVPSLVAEDGDGGVVGFIARHTRRMALDGQAIRVACCSHLVVDPGRRAGAAGALLLGHGLRGPQDLTVSDTATDVVARLWAAHGGRMDPSRSYEWMHLFRPATLAVGLARRRLGGARLGRPDIPVPGLPLHVAARLVPRLRPAADPDTAGESLDPAAAVAALAPVTRRMRLRPDYDEPYLAWLLGRLDATAGPVVRRLVRRAGRPVGWYVYLLRPGAVSRVLQVVCAERDADAVVGDLLADARRRGSALLTGRLEPHLHEALRRRFTAIGFGERHVVHTRRPEILEALGSGSALLGRLDGEWW